MPADLFERVIAKTLAQLPAAIREKLVHVSILVEEQPPKGEDPDLLGLFLGVSYQEKIRNTQAGIDRIILFRKNLREMCSSDKELAAEIRKTLIHEIGHYLGLDEDDLVERGLE